jgi:hypothetical protein
MCNLDHPIGQSLYRYKRYGNPLDGSLVALTLIQGIVSLVERLCSEGGPAEVVLLPISNDSFLSGRTHPNLLIYEGLRSRLAEPKITPRPLPHGPDSNARSVPVWLGLHAGKSRSLGRRAAAAKMPQGEMEEPAPCGRELNGFEAWQMEDLKWIGGLRSAATKQPEACGAQTIFVDDVLTSGYTAARVASIVDPQMKTVWTMVAAARAVYRSS